MANVFEDTEIRDSDPHLTVYIHAPGVMCFNEEMNRAEAGLLSLCDHEYFISIYDKSDGSHPGGVYKTPIKWGLTTIGSGGTINLLENNTNEDFDFIFELTDLYGPDIILQDPELWGPKFYFQDIVCATAGDSHVLAKPVPVGPGDPKGDGAVGRAVMLLSKNPILTIQLGDLNPIILDANKRYEMVIRSGPCFSVEGDFKRIYDALGKTHEEKHNLKYHPSTTVWRSPSERRWGRHFLERAANVLDDDPALVDANDREEIANNLRDLSDSVKCDGVSCQLCVIKTKSLSIP